MDEKQVALINETLVKQSSMKDAQLVDYLLSEFDLRPIEAWRVVMNRGKRTTVFKPRRLQ